MSSRPPSPAPLSGPISLGLRAEEELGLGALRVVQQEESEEVFVRSVELHLTLFPADGGEGSMVEHQEPATPAKHKARQPSSVTVKLHLPSRLWSQNPYPLQFANAPKHQGMVLPRSPDGSSRVPRGFVTDLANHGSTAMTTSAL